MKILILNEPFVKDFCRTQRWAARSRGRVLRPPDWLAYTTGVLESKGFDAKLYDLIALNQDKHDMRLLVKKSPRILSFLIRLHLLYIRILNVPVLSRKIHQPG